MKSISQFMKEILRCFYAPIFVFVFLSWLLGVQFHLYSLLPQYDIFVHFCGGVSMALTGFMLLKIAEKQKWIETRNAFLVLVLLICFVSFAATVWEFYEFLRDYFFHESNQLGLQDTMGDMFMGLLGALCGGGWMVYFKK